MLQNPEQLAQHWQVPVRTIARWQEIAQQHGCNLEWIAKRVSPRATEFLAETGESRRLRFLECLDRLRSAEVAA